MKYIGYLKGERTMRTSRKEDELREIKITRDFIDNPLSSVLIEMGRTKVLCTASLEERVPPFLIDSGKGWITAEYSMLPGSTNKRKDRDIKRLKLDGRSSEIQRLIGRSLRSCVDLYRMPNISIILDCDVIQADGGTRCASINGAYIALKGAINKLLEDGILAENPIIDEIAAVSVGLVDDKLLLDLDYLEDSNAQVDMNIVMTYEGNIIEIQGTGEGRSFTKNEMEDLVSLGEKGIREIIEKGR